MGCGHSAEPKVWDLSAFQPIMRYRCVLPRDQWWSWIENQPAKGSRVILQGLFQEGFLESKGTPKRTLVRRGTIEIHEPKSGKSGRWDCITVAGNGRCVITAMSALQKHPKKESFRAIARKINSRWFQLGKMSALVSLHPLPPSRL